MKVAGLTINVVRKDIKNLHLGVYPPAGRVRVAAPLVISDEAVRLAVIDKLAWIKLQRSKFEQQPRQSEREMAVGESHYVFGRRYRLRVHEAEGTPRVAMRGIASLDLFVRPGASQAQRAAVLDRWYREQLKGVVTPMFTTWQAKLGVQASAWGVKRMKTKWGSTLPRRSARPESANHSRYAVRLTAASQLPRRCLAAASVLSQPAQRRQGQEQSSRNSHGADSRSGFEGGRWRRRVSASAATKARADCPTSTACKAGYSRGKPASGRWR